MINLKQINKLNKTTNEYKVGDDKYDCKNNKIKGD
jgi:hypothetical protein